MRIALRHIGLSVLALLPTLAFAGTLPKQFTLGNYVPKDSWMVMHFVDHPDRAWIEAQWVEVFDMLKQTGIERDITKLAFSFMEEDQRDMVQALVDQWTKTVEAVAWGDLVNQEILYAQRVGELPQPYDYIFLARGKPGTGKANAEALANILKQLAALGEKVAVTESQDGSIRRWSLAVAGDSDVPFSVELMQKGDVISLTSSAQSASIVASLMNGKAPESSFAASPRFAEAIGHVKTPEHGVTFLDWSMFLSRLKEQVGGMAPGDAAKLISSVIDEVGFTDYAISSMETDGRRELTHEVTRLLPAKKNCRMANCCVGRRSFKRFDSFVPIDAKSFSVDTSIDIGGVYSLILDIVETKMPGGKEAIAKFDDKMAQVGFDPQRDVFSWWSGETVSVDLPASVVTPFGGGGDSVKMFRVKDSELASKKIDAALTFVTGMLQGMGQGLVVTPADLPTKGFKQIMYPMMPMLKPVIGVRGDWLVVATSTEALKKCFAVEAGEASSIAQNERFKREGLVHDGPVLGASFTDKSKFGEEMGSAAAMMGMFGGMATAMIPNEPGAKPVKKLVQGVLGIVMKLAPVLQKIDFYSSEAKVKSYDGELLIRTESVVTYKSPEGADDTRRAGTN